MSIKFQIFRPKITILLVYVISLLLMFTSYSCSLGKQLALFHAKNSNYQVRTPVFNTDNYSTLEDEMDSEQNEFDLSEEENISPGTQWKCDTAPVFRHDFESFSKRLGMCLNGNENMDLISAISDWLGTPYRGGGCSKSGVDCSCFVKAIYQKVFGVELSRSSAETFYHDIIPVKKEDLEEGDLIYFTTRKHRISHIGIYLKDGKFVHSSRKYGVTISNLDQEYYQRTFYSGGRVKLKGA